jgi:metal-responsive CopG/Arc/MetJ family transcriptional regulator
MPFARIAITLPKDILAAADRRAKALDRSRSRVIADALRAYLANPDAVRGEPTRSYGADEFGVARHKQLEADLASSPAERLRRSEETARLARRLRPKRGPRQQIIGFDSYEDFYEWKRNSRV